jgi:hypothetical protein
MPMKHNHFQTEYLLKIRPMKHKWVFTDPKKMQSNFKPRNNEVFSNIKSEFPPGLCLWQNKTSFKP